MNGRLEKEILAESKMKNKLSFIAENIFGRLITYESF